MSREYAPLLALEQHESIAPKVFDHGPLAGLAVKTTLAEHDFYEVYSEATKRRDHEMPVATIIADPTNRNHDAVSEVSRALEHFVFRDLDGNSREFLDEHYGPREPRNHFVLVADYQEDPALPFPAAMLRLDNTALAPDKADLAVMHPDVPEGLVSIEDIGLEDLWNVDIDALMAEIGLPDLRYGGEATDIVTIARHPLYKPAKGMTKDQPLEHRVHVAQALYREVIQLQRDYMVTILNKPAHRSIQGMGRPWTDYPDYVKPIKYDGDTSSFTSKPYYSVKAEYGQRLRTTEPNGEALTYLLFDRDGGMDNVHFGSTALLKAQGK